MNLLHLAWSSVPQDCYIPSISSLVLGLISCRMYPLSSCHRFSMGLKSGDSAGVFHQFRLVLQPLFCHVWRVLWVIVLHKFMPLQIDPLNKWQLSSPYVDSRWVLWPIRKYMYSGHAWIKLLYVYLHIGLLLNLLDKKRWVYPICRVQWPSGCMSNSASCTCNNSPRLGLRGHLDCALISPYDILEWLTKVLLCPLEPLLLVGFSNYLALRAASKRPS